MRVCSPSTDHGLTCAADHVSRVGEETFTIATRSVPEPNTAVLLALGSVGSLTYGWARHRRQMRRQRPVEQPAAPE